MNTIALIAILAAVFAVLLVSSASSKPRTHDPVRLAEPAFTRVFGALSPTPKLKGSWSYGFPAFEVTFRSKSEMEGAATLNADFKRELNALFEDYGVADRRFDAELAVFFTYPEHIAELVAAHRQKK